MPQQIRALSFKSDNLSWIPGTHVLERQRSYNLSPDLHTHTVARHGVVWRGINTFKTPSAPFWVSMSLLTDHMGLCFCDRMAQFT